MRPKRHWKKITPTDHTSTLLEILGGSFPTTKHSGGRYLKTHRMQSISNNAKYKNSENLGNFLKNTVTNPLFIR